MIVTLSYEECRYIQKQLNNRLDFLIVQDDSKFKRSETELCLSACEKIDGSIHSLFTPGDTSVPLFEAYKNEMAENNSVPKNVVEAQNWLNKNPRPGSRYVDEVLKNVVQEKN